MNRSEEMPMESFSGILEREFDRGSCLESSFAYSDFLTNETDRISYAENHPERKAFLHLLVLSHETTGFAIKELGELVDFIDDQINTKRDYPDDEFPYLGLENIESSTGNAIFDITAGKNILSTSRRFQKGNILYSGLRPYLNKVHLVDKENGIGSSELFVMKIKQEEILPEFILAYLLSRLTLIQNRWVLTGSSYPRLSEDDLKKLKIIRPSKSQQDAILRASGFDSRRFGKGGEDVDEIIDKCSEKLLEKLGIEVPISAKRYFFKTGNNDESDFYFRFPTELRDRLHHFFEHPKLEVLDQLKKKYETTALGNILKEPMVKGIQPEYSENGIPVIKTMNLKNHAIDHENVRNVSEEFFERCKKEHPEAVLKKGDILISATGYVSMGKVDMYNRDDPAIASVDLLILRTKNDYNASFLVHFLRSPLGQLQFEKWWSGSSGQIHIYERDMAQFLLPATSDDGLTIDQQKEIADKIDKYLIHSLESLRDEEAKKFEIMKKFERFILEGVD